MMSSERFLDLRNRERFDYPVALVGWMNHIDFLHPPYIQLGDILLMDAPINRSILGDLKAVSDTLVFDFIIDGLFLSRSNDYYQRPKQQ